jgi:tetratricopeptide (TPR) repeat protein
MGRIEKTVFISYRRTNVPWALAIYQNLTMHGYDVFFDYQSIDSGNFEKVILENIKSRAHFIIVLTPSALERCKEPDDWLRREIETAMDEKRNIVPLMLESFDFGSPLVAQALTGRLSTLNKYNGLRVYSEYFFDAMDRLRERYLNMAVSDIALPAITNVETQAVTKSLKLAASKAPQVEKEELTAQEWFERGYVFQEDKNLDEALRCYSEAIRLNPDLDITYNNLGALYSDLNRFAEAEEAYRQAIAKDPNYSTAYYNLGNLLDDLKRFAEAEEAYRQAIAKGPNDAKVYSNLGILLEKLGRYAEAEEIHRRAIAKDPNLAQAYYNLGNLLSDKKMERYAEAEEAYWQAIAKDPDDAKTYSNLGSLLQKLKRCAEAEEAYRLAIAKDPNLAAAYSNLGILLEKLERYAEAEEAYRKAIELDPSHANAYNNLIMLLRLNNRPEETMPLLGKIIEINPEDFNPYLAIASINKQIGKGVSNDTIEKARQFMPEGDLYNRACLESVCDNFDLAFEHLRKAAQGEQFNPSWAWDDPDLQWIRDDPRFTEIVGPRPK